MAIESQKWRQFTDGANLLSKAEMLVPTCSPLACDYVSRSLGVSACCTLLA